MSKLNNFGISPSPMIGTQTSTFPQSPVPTAPVVPSFTSAQTNPVIDAAAGPKCNIIWVDSIDKILAHPTSPNEHLYFADQNDSIIYVRKTDANGTIQNPLKALHYTVEDIPFGPEEQFVTKDEHKQLYELVEKLAGNVESMNGKLEKLLNG